MTEENAVDLPDPSLADLQQRDLPMPTVPVHVDGRVRTQSLPATRTSIYTVPINANLTRVLERDLKRSRAVLLAENQNLADTYWVVSHTATGTKAPWPQDVPLELHHCDEMYAAVGGAGTGVVTVICEYYAD